MKVRLDAALMNRAKRHLSASHDGMRALIRRYPDCPLHRGRSELFDTLASSIVGQQLSTKAASTIRQRLLASAGTARFDPASIARLSHAELRGAGLSNAKARYVTALAEAVLDGELNFRALAQQRDEDVIDALTHLPGIGTWTAQMFLMFALRRPDVASSGDLGLQRGLQMLYGLDARPTADAFVELMAPWRPYRSVASWYLWRLAG